METRTTTPDANTEDLEIKTSRAQRRLRALMAHPNSDHVVGRWQCWHPHPQPNHRHKYEPGTMTEVLVFATKTHPRIVRSRNRRRNKVARASRKANR